MPLPYWYWEKQVIESKTPSILAGLDYATESKYRKEGASFIVESGKLMSLGYETLATGVVFFHRFYMFHSFKTFPPHVTACCCLFLAGKVEETPKRCRDIIKTAKSLLSEEKFATFGDDPVEEVMAMERILLQTIKFDLKVQHPYFFLKKYIKCIKGSKDILQLVLQMAWNFVNDSLYTTLSIEWEPEIIAIAVIHLAGKLRQLKVVNWTGRQPEHKHWWDMFVQDLSIEILEDICHQILDLYSSKDKQSPIFLNITQSIKSDATNNVPEPPINTNPPPPPPPKEPKAETTPPFNHPQVNIGKTPKVAASWTPVTSFPPLPPSEPAIHPSFPLPNLNVPPPSPYTNANAALPPFPLTNLSVPPPSFPAANLAVPPPPMLNSAHYYGGEQYARYLQ